MTSLRLEWRHSELAVLRGGRMVVRIVDPSGRDVTDLLLSLASAADELALDDREWHALLAAAARAHERRGAA